MSGSDKSFDALCKKFGVIRVDDIEELASVTSALSLLPALPKSNHFGSLNDSGGETAIVADSAEIYAIEFLDFTSTTTKDLEKVLPSYATVVNPLDGTATICYDEDIYTNVLHTIANDNNVDGLIVGLTLAPNNDDAPATIIMANSIARMMNESKGKKPLFVIPLIESGRQENLCKVIMDAGVPILPPAKYGYSVLQKIIAYSKYIQTADTRTLEVALPSSYDINAKVTSYSEYESKRILKKVGFDVPFFEVVKTEDEAVKYAKEVGYPVVMKIDSSDILHKTEAGGVILNINSDQEVRDAYNGIMTNAEKYKADARINGVLLQKMLKKGIEVLIGINTDPQFGHMLMFGLGGIFVELFKGVSIYSVPFNKTEAIEIINSPLSSKLFFGYRNVAPIDMNILADMLVKVSEFAYKNADIIREMDINPLFVYEDGVAIADALITATADMNLFK